jgi:aromatic ring-opening dioxygenase catalytic subunit (LigB family)
VTDSSSVATAATKLPTFFISHGGGPCFDMDWGAAGNPFERLRTYLAGFADELGVRPRAILVVSAHWEEPVATVTTSAAPQPLYDYTGFPPHTYALRYDAPGSPALASRVRALLDAAGIASAADPRRGYDHGVFVPFRVMYPAADIPLVALSIEVGYDPARHLAIGAALAPLRDEGVLIVGSGNSFHNLRTFFDGRTGESAAFDAWLQASVEADPAQRDALLEHWAAAPGARASHPEEDHLVPLFVAAGAAHGEPGTIVYRDTIMNKPISGYRFG